MKESLIERYREIYLNREVFIIWIYSFKILWWFVCDLWRNCVGYDLYNEYSSAINSFIVVMSVTYLVLNLDS